jgi:flagellar motor switch protein FliG
MPKHEPKGGIQAVVEMLQVMDGASRDKLLANLAQKDAKLVEELGKRLFTFEDLVKLEAREMEELIRRIPVGKLALALRGASEELRAAFFTRMSQRAATHLAEEVDALGPKRVTDVQAARFEILRLVDKAAAGGRRS